MSYVVAALVVLLFLQLMRWLRSRAGDLPSEETERVRLRKCAKVKKQQHSVFANSPYHAVSIQQGAHACGPARALEGRRFLGFDAPVMPLEGCEASRCLCTYHHPDRRGNNRGRRMIMASLSLVRVGEDRRQQQGRRSSDEEDAFDEMKLEQVSEYLRQ